MGRYSRQTVSGTGEFLSIKPLVSIIIVNHRAKAVLEDCLTAIGDSSLSASLEVIIVNNPPEDDLSFIENFGALNIRIIPTEKRLGFGAACNLGVRGSSGDILLLLNPDVILKKDAIENLKVFVSDSTEKRITVGRLTDPNGNFQPSCRKFPTISNILFSRGSFLGKIAGKTNGIYTLPDYLTPTQVESGAAALMMIFAETYNELNGFDESFFMYMEDTDLCYRHFLNKGSVWFVPEAEGVHKWGYSTGQYRFRRILWHHFSVWKYFLKHYHRSPGEIIFLPILLFANCCLSLLAEMCSLRK